MSFKDLTSRAASAMQSKPDETPKTPAKTIEPKTGSKDAASKSEQS